MYKRVLLKISGEALAGGTGFGIDAVFIHKVASEIAEVHRLGCEIGIVVGGGEFLSRRRPAGRGYGSRGRRPHGHALYRH